MLRYETLDLRNSVCPDSEEGEEGHGTVVLRQVGGHAGDTSFAPSSRKGNGWRVCRASQSCKVQAECGT